MFLPSKYKSNNPEYAFQIDSSNQEILGWVAGKNDIVSELIIRFNSHEQRVILNKTRPLVKTLFPDVLANEHVGFSFAPDLNEDFIALINLNGKEVELTQFKKSNQELDPAETIVFVHIAKTAGSTINDFFIKALGANSCLTHIESVKNWIADTPKKKFISGHIVLEEFKNKIPTLEDCYTITSLREPLSHVISHISWIRYLSEEGQEARFNAHPEFIQKLSLKMKALDLSQVENISSLLSSLTPQEFNLLDNIQVRYLRNNTGKMVSELDVHDAVSNTRYFNLIGFDDNIDGFLKKISFDLRLESKQNNNRVNTQSNKFGLVEGPDQLNALLPLIKFDLMLYETLDSQRKKLGEVALSKTQLEKKALAPAKLNTVSTVFKLTSLENKTRQVKSIVEAKHLDFVEISPKSTQKIEPVVWAGTPISKSFTQSTSSIPPANIYKLNNIYLVGQGCLIDSHNQLFISDQIHMQNQQLKSGGANPQLIDTSLLEKQEVTLTKELTVRNISGLCVPLSRPGEGVYGHWLVDILPRVAFIQSQTKEKIKFISTIHIPDYARTLMAHLGVQDEDIITYKPMHEAVLMEHCYVPSYLRIRDAFSPLASKLNDRFLPHLAKQSNRKLFISRAGYNEAQSISNINELHKLVLSYGIEIIEPHKLPINEQIKLFSEASFIMGEYGSAMHNTMFSHRGTKVLVLQSDKPLPFVQAGIGALLEQPTGFVFGSHLKENNPTGRSFHTPLELVKQAIEQLI